MEPISASDDDPMTFHIILKRVLMAILFDGSYELLLKHWYPLARLQANLTDRYKSYAWIRNIVSLAL